MSEARGRIARLADEPEPVYFAKPGGVYTRLDGSRGTGRLGTLKLVRKCGRADFFCAVTECYLCGASLGLADELRSVRQLFWGIELVECRMCGLVQKRERANEELLAQIYRGGYSNFVAPGLADVRQTFGPRLRRLGRTQGRLLDIGCGNGGFALAARDYGFDAVGVDPFLPREAEALNVPLFREDILASDSRERLGLFDVVTLWAVWEHLTRPFDVLLAASQALAPRGRLVLNSPNGSSLHATRLSSWYMATLIEHLHFLNPRSCCTLAQRLGLELVSMRRCGVPFPLGGREPGAVGQGLNKQAQSFLLGQEYESASGSPGPRSRKSSFAARVSGHPVVGRIAREALALLPIGDHLEIILERV